VGQHPFDAQAEPFVARTLERLTGALGPEAITPAFAAAFRRWPRYRFVQRYTVLHRAWYDVARGQVLPHLQRLFGDGPICIKDDDSEGCLRVLSQLPAPATMARFIQLLKLRPGDRVLEVGSGSGWLLAMIADIVGPSGKVVGIEIDPEIVGQARRHLDETGLNNVEIVTGDAAVSVPEGDRYNRVVISAIINDLPRTVFSAAADDAILVAPAGTPGRTGRLYGWSRHGNVFRAMASVSSSCPPLLGRLAVPDPGLPNPAKLPFADLLRTPALHRAPCFAAQATKEQRLVVMNDFCSFLGVRFGRAWSWWVAGEQPGESRQFVGHYDRRSSSVGVLTAEGFEGYGADAAWKQIHAAWNEWLAVGRPSLSKYMLDIHPADARPAASSTCWVHQHRDSVFVWRLR